jgi:hypothetical protein
MFVVYSTVNAGAEPVYSFFDAFLEVVSRQSLCPLSTFLITSTSVENYFPLMCSLREVKGIDGAEEIISI